MADQLTNKELIEKLRLLAWAKEPSHESDWLNLAAQRLEGQIGEAKVERIARILYAQHRSIDGDVTLPTWDELIDFKRYAWMERARAALEAAREA